MTGRAEILMAGDGAAAYCEEVAVTMRDGAEFRGSQRYLVRRTEEGFAFLFAETGALFEELRFGCRIEGGGLRAEAVHVCGEDRYVSEYVLGPGRAFSIQHAVAGPRKRYTSVTLFTGVGEDRPGARELL